MDQIRVLLVGGPAGLFGVGEVSSLVDPVKVARCGGYEHFRYSGRSRDVHGAQVPVFEWCDRTKIAE
jgi:Family of unknown function (DUF5988)